MFLSSVPSTHTHTHTHTHSHTQSHTNTPSYTYTNGHTPSGVKEVRAPSAEITVWPALQWLPPGALWYLLKTPTHNQKLWKEGRTDVHSGINISLSGLS